MFHDPREIDLIEPGVVQTHRWRPDGDDIVPQEQEITGWCGVARKN